MSKRRKLVDAPNIPSYLINGDRATFQNMVTGATIGGWYLLLAETLFEWEGLPVGCNARFLERTLISHGKAAFYEIPDIGWVNLEAHPTGTYNIYGEPTLLNLRGFNGKAYNNVKAQDCILVRNNAEMIPTLPTIIQYTERLAKVQRAMDVNMGNLRTPFVFIGDQTQAASIRAFYNEVEKNEPLIILNNGINDGHLERLELPVHFFLDKLASYKRQLQSDLLTYLGIDNINFEKAAQMVDREVSANRELIERFLECGLTYRVKAAEELSVATGTEITVRPRQFQKVLITATDEQGSVREYNVYAEVDRRGKIYDDATTADPEL